MTRDWRGRRVFFAADLHAGGGGPADCFRRYAPIFDEFLRRLVQTPHTLVLVGDVVELWQFRSTEIAREYGAIGRLFGRLVEEGRLHYLPGNHDEDAAALPLLAGLTWMSPMAIFQTDAGRVWAEHGHRWDPWDRNASWRHRLLLAAAKTTKKISPNADVLDRYRAPADRTGPLRDDRLLEGARSILAGSGLAAAFMGHTHRSGVFYVDTPAGQRPYVNCGAWVEDVTPSLGVADAHGVRCIKIDPAAPSWAALFGQ